ncbi:MAG: hypothetical protein ACRC34_00360, partial [Cetobacterium sp.]
FTENGDIYISDTKGMLSGQNLDSLKFINNYKGIKKKIELSLNSINNLSFKVQNGYKNSDILVSDKLVNENVFFNDKLKIKIPKNMILDKDKGVKYVYNDFIEEKNELENYYYLNNSEMKTTRLKDEFINHIYEFGFKEDRIISVTNNPKDEVYFATTNIIYDKNYKVLYSGDGIIRINSKNKNIYIQKNDGRYILKNNILIKTTEKLDLKNSVSFNGLSWELGLDSAYKIDILNTFRDSDIFQNNYLIFENFTGINSIKNVEIRNGDYIFNYGNLSNLKEFNKVVYSKKEYYLKEKVDISKGIYLLKNLLQNSENIITGITTYANKLYILSEATLFTLENEILSKTGVKGDRIKNIGEKVVIYNKNKALLINKLGEVEKEIMFNSKNKVSINSKEVGNEISDEDVKIEFYKLSNNSVFRNGYFIFDDMENLDFIEGRIYRNYKDISNQIQNYDGFGELHPPVKKIKYKTEICFNSVGEIKLEKKSVQKDEEEKISFIYNGNKRQNITYNSFKDIAGDKISLYILGYTDSFKVDSMSSSLKISGVFKEEYLREAKSILGKNINIKNNKFEIKDSKKVGLSWTMDGISQSELWREIDFEKYNFVNTNYIDLTEEFKFYTDGRYIFDTNKNLYLDTKSRDIQKIENQNQELFIMKKSEAYNSDLKKVDFKNSPFTKSGLDLSDGELKKIDNDNVLNYKGESILGKNNRLSVDSV